MEMASSMRHGIITTMDRVRRTDCDDTEALTSLLFDGVGTEWIGTAMNR